MIFTVVMISYKIISATHTKGGFRGRPREPVPPFKNFYLYVTATINNMNITFNDV